MIINENIKKHAVRSLWFFSVVIHFYIGYLLGGWVLENIGMWLREVSEVAYSVIGFVFKVVCALGLAGWFMCISIEDVLSKR